MTSRLVAFDRVNNDVSGRRCRFGDVRVLVPGRSVSGRTEAVLQLDDQRVRRHGQHTGIVVGVFLPVEHGVAGAGRGERGRLRVAVLRAGAAYVAERPRTRGRRRGSRAVVRHGGGQRRGRRRRCGGRPVVQRGGNGGGRDGDGLGPTPSSLVVRVRAAGRVEARAHHARVLRVPTVQRHLPDDLLLGGRAARLPRAVGRRGGHRVPVRHARRQLRGVRVAAPGQAQDVGRRQLRGHGHVADGHHRVHEGVQRRCPAAVRPADRGRVHRVRVLRPDRDAAHAVDAVRRSIPDGRQR